MEDIAGWMAGLDELMGRVAPRFGRVEPRRRAPAYLLGLLAPLAGKNSWTIAEAAGGHAPDGMQRLLSEASGTPTRYAMTYASTSPTISARPTGC